MMETSLCFALLSHLILSYIDVKGALLQEALIPGGGHIRKTSDSSVFSSPRAACSNLPFNTYHILETVLGTQIIKQQSTVHYTYPSRVISESSTPFWWSGATCTGVRVVNPTAGCKGVRGVRPYDVPVPPLQKK